MEAGSDDPTPFKCAPDAAVSSAVDNEEGDMGISEGEEGVAFDEDASRDRPVRVSDECPSGGNRTLIAVSLEGNEGGIAAKVAAAPASPPLFAVPTGALLPLPPATGEVGGGAAEVVTPI